MTELAHAVIAQYNFADPVPPTVGSMEILTRPVAIFIQLKSTMNLYKKLYTWCIKTTLSRNVISVYCWGSLFRMSCLTQFHLYIKTTDRLTIWSMEQYLLFYLGNLETFFKDVCAPWHTVWAFIQTQIAMFMGPTLGPPGSCRPQMGPCWPHEPCYQGKVTKEKLFCCTEQFTDNH